MPRDIYSRTTLPEKNRRAVQCSPHSVSRTFLSVFCVTNDWLLSSTPPPPPAPPTYSLVIWENHWFPDPPLSSSACLRHHTVSCLLKWHESITSVNTRCRHWYRWLGTGAYSAISFWIRASFLTTLDQLWRQSKYHAPCIPRLLCARNACAVSTP